ncbi:MAG: hypothetical protein MJZ77_08295 [Bacteroidales bacterium]|nr:hypothetical protein [Bacteroidales bacterium]
MTNLMYIHGYGSTGKAVKAQLMQEMFPSCTLLAPTFDYARQSPQEVLQELRRIIKSEHPALILGSSTGGYFALCCTHFFDGPVWCLNPVRDILDTISRIFPQATGLPAETLADRKFEYEHFDREVFQTVSPHDRQLHFALSTDDELLGDHSPLLLRYPNHGTVVWKDRCGHRFLRFNELKVPLAATLQQEDSYSSQ